ASLLLSLRALSALDGVVAGIRRAAASTLAAGWRRRGAASGDRCRADAGTAVLHRSTRTPDALREVFGEPAVLLALRGERHRDRRVARMAVVWKQHAAIERRQRERH